MKVRLIIAHSTTIHGHNRPHQKEHYLPTPPPPYAAKIYAQLLCGGQRLVWGSVIAGQRMTVDTIEFLFLQSCKMDQGTKKIRTNMINLTHLNLTLI